MMTGYAAVRRSALESLPPTVRNPMHGSGLATQRELHAFLETMPDGTRVLYRPDGTPIRQWDVDGIIHRFDGHDRPVPATAMDDATQAASATPAAHHQKALVVDQPDGHGRPLGVTFPDGTQAHYQYRPDGGRIVSYSTGVVTTEDPWGHILTERLPNGTVLTSFDSNGRSIGSSMPDAGASGPRPVRDAVAQPASVTADDPRLAYRDRTMVSPSAPAARQVTEDGTVYDGFDDQGRATSGVTPSGSRFSLTYDAKGDSFQHLADGTTVETSPAGKVVKQVAADGTVYEGFDGQGRPTSGTSSDGSRFTITYDAKGDSFQHLSDSTTAEYSPAGRALNQVTADGAMLGGQGGPASGTLPDGTHYTVRYDAQGDSFQHISNGTTVEYSPTGKVIKQVAPDGTVIDGFDGQGRPTSGTSPDGSRFTTTYDAQGDTFQHSSGGTTVEYDKNGHPIRTWTADGSAISWSVDVPALANAASRVAAEEELIKDAVRSLKATFTDLEGVWTGPAGTTVPPLVNSFNTITDQLVALLDDSVIRMRTAYQNYVSTESTNASNLQ